MIFNLFLTLATGFIIATNAAGFVFGFDNFNPVIGFYLLFPIWTLFVTIASAKYAFFNPTNKDLHLP